MLDRPDRHPGLAGDAHDRGAEGAEGVAGGVLVVLAAGSAADLRAAWVGPSGTATPLPDPPFVDATLPDAPEPGVDGTDRVDRAADALERFAADAHGVPHRLWMIASPGTAFADHDEASALAGLPAPTWMPLPVALAGTRLASRLYGPAGSRHHWAGADDGRIAVVLDARGDTLTAWPIRRGPDGPTVVRGPLDLLERLDQLVAGVVRATAGPGRPGGPAGPADPGIAGRRDAARLRRGVRRARRTLLGTEASEATVASGGREAVVERAVFDQLLAHAVTECLTRLDPDAGVELLVDGPGPAAAVLTRTTGAALPPATGGEGSSEVGSPEGGSAAVEGAVALLRASGHHASPAPAPAGEVGTDDAVDEAGDEADTTAIARPEEPVHEEAFGDSAIEEPVIEEPVIEEPALDEPARAEPAVAESAVAEPAVAEPPSSSPSPPPAPQPLPSAASDVGEAPPAPPPDPGRRPAPGFAAGRSRAAGRVAAVLAVVVVLLLVAAIGVLVLGPRPSEWTSTAPTTVQDVTAST